MRGMYGSRLAWQWMPALAAHVLTALETLEMAAALVRSRAVRLQTNKGSSILNDYKLGFRMLVKYPGLTVVATIAVGFAIAVGSAHGIEISERKTKPAPTLTGRIARYQGLVEFAREAVIGVPHPDLGEAVVAAVVFQVFAQRELAAQESDLGPGDRVFREQRRFLRFLAGGEPALEPRGEKQVHLAGFDHVDRSEQVPELDFGTSLLAGFARRTFRNGFPQFHEARRYRPVAHARFDGALAQQNAPVLFRHAADDDLGVLVMDRATTVADPALA